MGDLGAEELLVRLAIVLDQARRMAVAAAEDAGRGNNVAVGADRKNDAVFQHPHLAGQAAAAAMASGGTRILNERVLVDQQTVFVFQRFGGQVRGVGDMDVDAVHAVAVVARPVAATERFQIDVRSPPIAALSGEDDGGDRIVARRHHPFLGHQALEGTQDGASDLVGGDAARPDGAGKAGIGDGAFGGIDLDGVEKAAVGQQLGIEDGLDGVIRGGAQRAVGQAHGAPRLGTGAGEVEGQLLAAYPDRGLDGDHIAAQAVVIHVTDEAVIAVFQLGDAVEQPSASIGQDVLDGAFHRRHPHLTDEPVQHGAATLVGRYLDPEVQIPVLGLAGVVDQQIHEIDVDDAGAGDADHRDANAFFEDGPRSPRDGAGNGAADVRMVAHVGGEELDDAIPENRRHHAHVRLVGAVRQVDVVADEGVSFLHVVDRIALQHRPGAAQQRAQVHGHVRGLADAATAPIEQTDRAVAALLDVGRERRAD